MVLLGQKLFFSGKNGSIWAKVVLFGQEWLCSCKVVVFGQKLLYSGKSSCIRAKVVLLGPKWLFSGKVVLFGLIGCIREKWLYSS